MIVIVILFWAFNIFDFLLCMQRALLVCEVDDVAEEGVEEEVVDNI